MLFFIVFPNKAKFKAKSKLKSKLKFLLTTLFLLLSDREQLFQILSYDIVKLGRNIKKKADKKKSELTVVRR